MEMLLWHKTICARVLGELLDTEQNNSIIRTHQYTSKKNIRKHNIPFQIISTIREKPRENSTRAAISAFHQHPFGVCLNESWIQDEEAEDRMDDLAFTEADDFRRGSLAIYCIIQLLKLRRELGDGTQKSLDGMKE